MKKSLYAWIALSLFLLGCQETEQTEQSPEIKEETHMDDEKINDMADLFESPMTEGNNPIDHVIKVVISKGSASPEETIAIDIQNEKIYLEPRISTTGIEAKTGSVSVHDVDQVLPILTEHHVQDWNTETAIHPDDGNGQNVWLQFEDGTVARYHEATIGDTKSTKTFETLIQEIQDFVDARVITIDPKAK